MTKHTLVHHQNRLTRRAVMSPYQTSTRCMRLTGKMKHITGLYLLGGDRAIHKTADSRKTSQHGHRRSHFNALKTPKFNSYYHSATVTGTTAIIAVCLSKALTFPCQHFTNTHTAQLTNVHWQFATDSQRPHKKSFRPRVT